MQPNILYDIPSSESFNSSKATFDELTPNDKTQDDRVFRLLVSYTDNKTSKKDRIKQRKRRHKLEMDLKVLKNDIKDLRVLKNDIKELKDNTQKMRNNSDAFQKQIIELLQNSNDNAGKK